VSTVLAIIIAGAALVLVVIGRIFVGLVTNDVKGWLPRWSASLVRRASEHLPAEHRPRWEEEALADVDQFADRPLTGFLHALGMARSVKSLARELTAAPAGDAVVSTGGRRGRLWAVAAMLLTARTRALVEAVQVRPAVFRRMLVVLSLPVSFVGAALVIAQLATVASVVAGVVTVVSTVLMVLLEFRR
jgi:hypothetical protein